MKAVLGVLIVLVGVFAYAAASGDAQPAGTTNRLNLGVVAIESRIGGDPVIASGTVIDADRGLVLTSARTVWGATSIRLSTGLGILHGRIVARAPCDELALVEIQPRVPGLVSLTDRIGRAPAPNTLVTAYGRRITKPATGLLTIPARVTDTPFRLDALFVPEAAGGPIMDAQGQLVGIVSPIGNTIPWQAVKRRLDELRPGPRRIFSGWRGQYICAARLNRVMQTAHPAFKPEDARLVVAIPEEER